MHLSVRSTRGTRRELERFVREVRRSNPGARVKMDYDKVEVGARSYVFDCEEGRVVQREQVRIGFRCKINKYTRNFDYLQSSMPSTIKFNSSPNLQMDDLKNIEEGEEDIEDNRAVFEKQEIIRKLEMEMKSKTEEMEKLREMIQQLECSLEN